MDNIEIDDVKDLFPDFKISEETQKQLLSDPEYGFAQGKEAFTIWSQLCYEKDGKAFKFLSERFNLTVEELQEGKSIFCHQEADALKQVLAKCKNGGCENKMQLIFLQWATSSYTLSQYEKISVNELVEEGKGFPEIDFFYNNKFLPNLTIENAEDFKNISFESNPNLIVKSEESKFHYFNPLVPESSLFNKDTLKELLIASSKLPNPYESTEKIDTSSLEEITKK